MKLLVNEVDSDLARVILENEAIWKHIAARQLELALRIVLLAKQWHEVRTTVHWMGLEVRLRLFDVDRLQVWKELKSTFSHLLVKWDCGLRVVQNHKLYVRFT